MLVFFRHPYGSTKINGKLIYGYLESHAPVVIPWNVYKQCKNSLIQAPYDKRILEELFPDRTFPDLTFTYYGLRFLNWEQMCALCQAFGFTTSRSNVARRRKLRRFMQENC